MSRAHRVLTMRALSRAVRARRARVVSTLSRAGEYVRVFWHLAVSEKKLSRAHRVLTMRALRRAVRARIVSTLSRAVEYVRVFWHLAVSGEGLSNLDYLNRQCGVILPVEKGK